MKSKTILLFAIIVLTLSSCQRGCQKWKRDNMTSKRDYQIILISGGDTVFMENFHGIITEEEGNGMYYYKGDTLVELSGDYIIKSVK